MFHYARNPYCILNIFLGGMYSGIFNPIAAHSKIAPREMNYIVVNASGSIMRCNSTGESGTVMPAQNHSHKRYNFKSISK